MKRRSACLLLAGAIAPAHHASAPILKRAPEAGAPSAPAAVPGIAPVASSAPSVIAPPVPDVSLGVYDVTAYCLTGTMADGEPVHAGAAASNLWPLGTRLDVSGVGEVTVEDRVGWGADVDVWMGSCAEAIDFGRHWLNVSEVAA